MMNLTLITKRAKRKLAQNLATPLHLLIPLEGKTMAYCYIRKNACSSFKYFISATLENTEKSLPLRELTATYRATPQQVMDADYTVFVYRDPLQRIASLYLNKFMQNPKGGKDLFKETYAQTGIEPEDMTFTQFVEQYLAVGDIGLKDPHVLPQGRHLLDIDYTHALTLGTLVDRMKPLIGEERAARYFSKRRNGVKTNHDDYRDFDLSMMPARKIREIYTSNGRYAPKKASLITPDLKACLLDIYQEDIALKMRYPSLNMA